MLRGHRRICAALIALGVGLTTLWLEWLVAHFMSPSWGWSEKLMAVEPTLKAIADVVQAVDKVNGQFAPLEFVFSGISYIGAWLTRN